MSALRAAVLVGAGVDLLVRGPRQAPARPAPAAVARPRRRSRAWRTARACALLAWGAVAGLTIGLVLCLSVPRLAGDRSFTEMSGSMRPALQPGDVVIDATIRARDARPGDVVTFPDPTGSSRLITHRVRSIVVNGAVAHFVTRGDANDVAETWSARADGRIGRVRSHVPKIGYAVVHLGSPGGALLLVTLPCLLLGAIELRRIWRRSP